MTTELEASVTCLDSIIEKEEFSKIREIKTDYDDAVKVILYLRAICSMMTVEKKREELLGVCFDMCVSHGMLSCALECAFQLQFDVALEKVRELIHYCDDLSSKPKNPCEAISADGETTSPEGGAKWRPVCCLNWKFTDEAKEKQIREALKLQLIYQLAEHRFVPDHASLLNGLGQEPGVEVPGVDPKIDSILRRDYMQPMFEYLSTELDVVAAKNIEDILRSDEPSRLANSNLDASRNALVLSYGNAFLHSGYGIGSFTDESVIQKTRNHAITSSIACIGLLNLWRVEQGLSELDKYQYSQDHFTRAGALLGFGICNSGTYNDCDPVLSLVSDSISGEDQDEKIAAYIALGYACCGTQREDIFNLLLPSILMPDVSFELSSAAALALGFIFAGSGNTNLAEILCHSLVERQNAIDTIHVYNFALAVGLIYLGVRANPADETMGENAEPKEEVEALLADLDHPLKQFTLLMVLVCRNAGSGNILHCQKCLQICVEAQTQSQVQPVEKLVKDDIQSMIPALALVGYSLINVGEPIGEEMLMRMINHMLQYDTVALRRAVPWALALHSPSSPKTNIVDVLNKLTHDPDADTALHAIISLGVVAAGTNNARVAQILRGLATFYAVDSDGLFLVKMAQGLVHAGKGLHTLSPLHGDRKLVIKNSLVSLVAFVVQGLFTQETLCQGRYHANLFHLTVALRPRWLITVDEEGNPVPVPVRVGQYVDVAGIAGQPRQVAGFRTHNTPILLSDGEKAEMGCAEWQPLANCMEGIVVVRKTDPSELKEALKNLE